MPSTPIIILKILLFAKVGLTELSNVTCSGHFGTFELVGTASSLFETLVIPLDGGRTLLASSCSDSQLDGPTAYAALRLLGKSLSFGVDLSSTECGCVLSFDLSSSPDGDHESCAAGSSCVDIVAMKANRRAFLTGMIETRDPLGLMGGLGGGQAASTNQTGWLGPRDFSKDEYGPGGSCVDTNRPFEVAISFPLDESRGMLKEIRLVLSQASSVGGDACEQIEFSVGSEAENIVALAQVTQALHMGVTPSFEYRLGAPSLMTGLGADGGGPCESDSPPDSKSECKTAAAIRNVVVEDLKDTKGKPSPHKTKSKSKKGTGLPAGAVFLIVIGFLGCLGCLSCYVCCWCGCYGEQAAQCMDFIFGPRWRPTVPKKSKGKQGPARDLPRRRGGKKKALGGGKAKPYIEMRSQSDTELV
eukprot:CAMPEP_0172649294 /NCGR_PEP_ID=MMETSP1068-20121228/241714_1 /TAXON_ID=35684 /ORGANISM="Pseudopedinella elastica, Strain CCMP716" /LENGTH=415 /DNA_ID=CAMNT_0013463643 /DNA_START=71 /DNA_END=1318 /DNA_ORIENTATION=-